MSLSQHLTLSKITYSNTRYIPENIDQESNEETYFCARPITLSDVMVFISSHNNRYCNSCFKDMRQSSVEFKSYFEIVGFPSSLFSELLSFLPLKTSLTFIITYENLIPFDISQPLSTKKLKTFLNQSRININKFNLSTILRSLARDFKALVEILEHRNLFAYPSKEQMDILNRSNTSKKEFNDAETHKLLQDINQFSLQYSMDKQLKNSVPESVLSLAVLGDQKSGGIELSKSFSCFFKLAIIDMANGILQSSSNILSYRNLLIWGAPMLLAIIISISSYFLVEDDAIEKAGARYGFSGGAVLCGAFMLCLSSFNENRKSKLTKNYQKLEPNNNSYLKAAFYQNTLSLTCMVVTLLFLMLHWCTDYEQPKVESSIHLGCLVNTFTTLFIWCLLTLVDKCWEKSVLNSVLLQEAEKNCKQLLQEFEKSKFNLDQEASDYEESTEEIYMNNARKNKETHLNSNLNQNDDVMVFINYFDKNENT